MRNTVSQSDSPSTNSPVRIAVSGAEGRVGKLLVQAVADNAKTQLVAELNRKNTLETIQNKKSGASPTIDVIIDFTQPAVTLSLLPICCQNNYRLVIGTTGFTSEQKAQILKAAKEIPIILAPNMSIGINVTYKLLELAAKLLKDQPIDVAVTDLHHKHKKDAPSGTALRMGEVITEACNKPTDIAYTALRLGDSIGEHSALFALPGERIEITHKSLDRTLYAKGALQAAIWLMNQPAGLYSMQDVLGLNK